MKKAREYGQIRKGVERSTEEEEMEGVVGSKEGKGGEGTETKMCVSSSLQGSRGCDGD